MKHYVCNSCGEDLPENNTLMCSQKTSGYAKLVFLPEERYHNRWEGFPGMEGMIGGGQWWEVPCGPMHEENEQEYFVRWCLESNNAK